MSLCDAQNHPNSEDRPVFHALAFIYLLIIRTELNTMNSPGEKQKREKELGNGMGRRLEKREVFRFAQAPKLQGS